MYLYCSLVSELNNRIPYLTDLSDKSWEIIKPYFPNPGTNKGRKRVHSFRAILNGIFYLLCTVCSWRMLPYEFPQWKTVYHYFRL
jgi:putative transposase